MPTGLTGPEYDPGGGPVSPDAKILAEANQQQIGGMGWIGRQSLVPSVHAQVEFWEKAAFAALAGLARRTDTHLDTERIAERAAHVADGLTKQWLRRLQQWQQGSGGT